MKNLFLILGLVLVSIAIQGQSLFRFFAYEIKPGKTAQFNNGFRRNIEWHQQQKDDWSWYAWFVIHGNRKGTFIDGTPNHKWSDFDGWKISSAENIKYNDLDFTEYIEKTVETGTWKYLWEFSTNPIPNLKATYLQVFYFTLKPGATLEFEKYIGQRKPKYEINWFKDVLNGSTKYILQIPHNNWGSFLNSEVLYFDHPDLSRLVAEMTSEVLQFHPRLTLENGVILD